jgi:hypothetical protein
MKTCGNPDIGRRVIVQRTDSRSDITQILIQVIITLYVRGVAMKIPAESINGVKSLTVKENVALVIVAAGVRPVNLFGGIIDHPGTPSGRLLNHLCG